MALALAAPVFAQRSEGWFDLAPCELCLWQRWPYWAAAAAAGLAVALPGARRWLLALAGAGALVSAVIGAFHMGVEWRWWPSPLPGCAAPLATGTTVTELLQGLRAAPAKPCDEPAFLIRGLPLSMAGINTIYGACLGAFALMAARRSRA